jgi:guanylate kinase
MKTLLESWKDYLNESNGGTILAIFGPSGSGKSRQKNIFRQSGWDEIVSFVTRPPRGDADAEYEFTTEEEWKAESEKGNLLNTNEYAGNFYGTKISDFRNADKAILVTDITNVDGSRGEQDLNNVAKRLGKRLVLIFSAPPAAKELIRRHQQRLASGEYSSQEEFDTRVQQAREESDTMQAKVNGLSAEVYTIYNDEEAQELAEKLK